MLLINTLVFTTETLAGSSLKCEEPNIPGNIFPSALVTINSAYKMIGLLLSWSCSHMLPYARCSFFFLPDAKVYFIASGTSPRVSLHLHTDHSDRSGCRFKRKDLCQVRHQNWDFLPFRPTSKGVILWDFLPSITAYLVWLHVLY